MKANALKNYSAELNALSTTQIYSILDRGIELASHTDLVNSLSDGGSALFPHTFISKCGDQIAAVVHAALTACQKTEKHRILLIGVLHSLTTPLINARKQALIGTNVLNDPCRGVFGPGLPNEELCCEEFSLDNFLFLFKHAVKRNDLEPPELVIRYPNLIQGQPELIPGIEELKRLVNESIVVATSDLCHHGIAYGQSKEQSLPISKQGYDFAYQVIQDHLHLFTHFDSTAYRQYCIGTLSDSIEVGQLLNYLLGPLKGSICDLKLVDVSDLFERTPTPSWVAAALIELKKGHRT